MTLSEAMERIVSAVPDIGDKAAREATIARMAYSAGMAAERERCANECRRLYFTRGCIANGLDCEAAIRGA